MNFAEHYREYTEYAKQYGDVYLARLPFGERMVVINTVPMIKIAINNAANTGRPLIKAPLPIGISASHSFELFINYMHFHKNGFYLDLFNI